MEALSPPFRHQESLNFGEEIQRRGIPTFEKHENQRFAHEMKLEEFFEKNEKGEFVISENVFRRGRGAGPRRRNGFCTLNRGAGTMNISLFLKVHKPNSVKSVSVVGESLKVRDSHFDIKESLQPSADYENGTFSGWSELGHISRTLVRRYMLNSSSDAITWMSIKDVTNIKIISNPPTPPREIDIPIVVED